ncbi:MAG: hypothetical protein PHW97_08640, partial [Fermentimonas sp.]|nr:hypothetical protein [Fermentimonas sp.]
MKIKWELQRVDPNSIYLFFKVYAITIKSCKEKHCSIVAPHSVTGVGVKQIPAIPFMKSIFECFRGRTAVVTDSTYSFPGGWRPSRWQ